jgi:hypothetical protein
MTVAADPAQNFVPRLAGRVGMFDPVSCWLTLSFMAFLACS